MLCKPVVENLNESDRIRGSKIMVKSLKAQINSLKLGMNRGYLICTKKSSLNLSVHQYLNLFINKLFGARAGIISRREFIRKQSENSEKQKELDVQLKLARMQNPQMHKWMIRLLQKPLNQGF